MRCLPRSCWLMCWILHERQIAFISIGGIYLSIYLCIYRGGGERVWWTGAIDMNCARTHVPHAVGVQTPNQPLASSCSSSSSSSSISCTAPSSLTSLGCCAQPSGRESDGASRGITIPAHLIKLASSVKSPYVWTKWRIVWTTSSTIDR